MGFMQKSVIFLLHVFTITCAYTRVDIEFYEEIAEANLLKKLEKYKNEFNGELPKNIILFIGDGMGLSAVTGARTYKSQKKGIDQNIDPLFFETFGDSALVKTSAFNRHVTDSAAGAMALFGGRKVFFDSLGLLPKEEFSFEDQPNCTGSKEDFINDRISDLAIEKGLSAGFVTTTPLTHATPGALYAKGMNRFAEFDNAKFYKKVTSCKGLDIAQQLLQHPANKFKVLMGGGAAMLTDKQNGGFRSDGKDILNDWKSLEGKRTIVTNPNELDKLNVEESEHVMGVFTKKYFPYYLDESSNGHKTVPRLSEMTEKAIRVMENNNENGYFLMIEGGIIDIAEHQNKLRQTFEEVLQLDDAIKLARTITNSSETLIIVTADHSHALSMPGYLSKKHGILENQKDEDQFPDDPKKIPGFMFAAGPGGATPLNYTKEDSESTDFLSPALIHSTNGVHGGEDVGLWADGPYAWLFGGTMDNTEVAYMMKTLLNLRDSDENIVKKYRRQSERPFLVDNKFGAWKEDLVTIVGEHNIWTVFICSVLISIVCIVISIFSLCAVCRLQCVSGKSTSVHEKV